MKQLPGASPGDAQLLSAMGRALTIRDDCKKLLMFSGAFPVYLLMM